MSARCKGCGAPIVWGKTTAGKNVPLDPPEKRYIQLTDQVHGDAFRLVDTWLGHHVTCPKRDDFRRTR